MVPFDCVQTSGSTRPRAGMAALSFRERTGLRRLANTERQSSGYLTSRRSLSVRFATPASPGRSEKLLSESGSRPARGPEPVRHRFGPQPLSVFWPKTDNSVLVVILPCHELLAAGGGSKLRRQQGQRGRRRIWATAR